MAGLFSLESLLYFERAGALPWGDDGMKARTGTIEDTATGLLVIPCSPAGDGVCRLESFHSIPGPALWCIITNRTYTDYVLKVG